MFTVGEVVVVWEKEIYDNSILSTPFCCEPKKKIIDFKRRNMETALKKESNQFFHGYV